MAGKLCESMYVRLYVLGAVNTGECCDAPGLTLTQASAAGGSFLLVIVCLVNGCKNNIEPHQPGRLPPLMPAATGEEGKGVHINLHRNL